MTRQAATEREPHSIDPGLCYVLTNGMLSLTLDIEDASDGSPGEPLSHLTITTSPRACGRRSRTFGSGVSPPDDRCQCASIDAVGTDSTAANPL
ncbi:hypothetical protein ACGFIW_04345 [Micromonospora sp. NPDC048935]|uniref:hypothetical protein n=1 Tax=Micromonospora sp. NPDC048935 TaxID=3364262 RepID=UPI00370F8814